MENKFGRVNCRLPLTLEIRLSNEFHSYESTDITEDLVRLIDIYTKLPQRFKQLIFSNLVTSHENQCQNYKNKSGLCMVLNIDVFCNRVIQRVHKNVSALFKIDQFHAKD